MQNTWLKKYTVFLNQSPEHSEGTLWPLADQVYLENGH